MSTWSTPWGPVSPIDALTRLEQIERLLAKRRQSTRALLRRRHERTVLALLLTQRLVLEQLGFDSYADYEARMNGTTTPVVEREFDYAYVEFAQLEIDMAHERLAAIAAAEDLGDLDLPYSTDDARSR